MTYFLFELKLFFTNRENILFLLLLFLFSALLSFSGFFRETRYEKVDPAMLEVRATQGNSQSPTYELDVARFQAFEEQDYPTFLKQSVTWYDFEARRLSFPPRYYANQNPFGKLDGSHSYGRTLALYRELSQQKEVRLSQINEETFWYQLVSSTRIMLPFILIVLLLSLAEIVTRDRQNYSVFYSFPVKPIVRVLSKWGVAILMWLALLVSYSFGVFIGTFNKGGVGSLSDPYPVYAPADTVAIDNPFALFDSFVSLPLFEVLLKIIGLFFMMALVFIGLQIIISLMTKKYFYNLVFLLPFVGYAFLPKERYFAYYQTISLNPLDYLNSQAIVSGHQNFYGGSLLFTFKNGCLAWGIVLICLMVSLLLIRRRIEVSR